MPIARHSRSSVRLGALLAALAGGLALGGCGSASTGVVGPSASKCQLTLAGPSGSFPPGTASGTVGISTDRECSWSATSQSSWLSFTTPVTGQGDATLSFTLAANPAAAARTTQIQVNDQQVQVAQDAAPCRFQIDPTSDSVAASGGGGSVGVSTVAGCTWTASSGASWISVQGGGSGAGRASFTVAANAGAARSSTLTVAGQPFVITQAGVPIDPPAPAPPPAPHPPPAPAPCRYSISPTSRSLASGGGTVAVSVSAGTGCTWTATSQAGWISVAAGGDSGSGNGGVTVVVEANPTANDRTGTVLIAGIALTVNEAGLPVVQVEGTVSRRSGGCPSITFVVGSSDVGTSAAPTTITTNGSTSYSGGSCGDVVEGAKVHVSGIQQPNGTVMALTVQIQKAAKG